MKSIQISGNRLSMRPRRAVLSQKPGQAKRPGRSSLSNRRRRRVRPGVLAVLVLLSVLFAVPARAADGRECGGVPASAVRVWKLNGGECQWAGMDCLTGGKIDGNCLPASLAGILRSAPLWGGASGPDWFCSGQACFSRDWFLPGTDADPVKPVNPEEPAKPAEPGTSVTPIPAEPGTSVTPIPAEPERPAEPEEPVKPAEPVETPDSGSGTLLPYEAEVVRLVNEIRKDYGLSALKADGELSRGARLKSRDMLDKGYFSHTSPTYGTPFQMMKSLGITYRTAGENIAYGYATPQAVVDGWMNSEGHRANILNSAYTRIGVGYVEQGHYWTQWFTG